MRNTNPLDPFLARDGTLILDGGLATELEARGYDLDDDLWSARLLLDEPGAIGSIGNALGENNINISQMQVGTAIGGENNIILIKTDVPMSDDVKKQVQDLPKVKSIQTLEL